MFLSFVRIIPVAANRMSQTPPIKRSKELVSLSKEHHDGLLLCWKINSGLKKGNDPARNARYIVFFYVSDLCRHFIEEEKFIFPLLPAGNSLRTTAEEQHKMLRSMIDNF